MVLINYLNEFKEIAKTVYEVDPAIFIFLYLTLTPTYYLGAGIIAKDALRLRKDCKSTGKKFKIHDLFLMKGFLSGYAMNRLSWAGPYIYVIFWGKNLPTKFYIVLISWTLFSAYITLHNLKNMKIKKNKKVGVKNG